MHYICLEVAVTKLSCAWLVIFSAVALLSLPHFACLLNKCNLICTALYICRLNRKESNKPLFLAPAPHWVLLHLRRMAQSGIQAPRKMPASAAPVVRRSRTQLGAGALAKTPTIVRGLFATVAQPHPQEPNAASGQPQTTTALISYTLQLKNIRQGTDPNARKGCVPFRTPQ